MLNLHRSLSVCIVFFLFAGCSVKRAVVTTSEGLLQDVTMVLRAESDLEIAQQSLACGITLIDAMRVSKPRDSRLAVQSIQGRAVYAMAFVEDQNPGRAAALYRRAMEDGLDLIKAHEGFDGAWKARDPAAFAESLDRLKPREFPLFFWTVFAWAGWVNLSRDAPEATSQLELVGTSIDHLIERSEGYDHGSPHLLAGAFYSSRSAMLGGDPERGRRHFEKAIELSKGENLLAKVYLAEQYAVQVQDKELFSRLLQEVLAGNADSGEDLRLLNQIARRRAASLLAKVDDLFF